MADSGMFSNASLRGAPSADGKQTDLPCKNMGISNRLLLNDLEAFGYLQNTT